MTPLVAAALLISGATQSQSGGNPWRQLTEADVEAAHALLQDDHPGAAEAAGDALFRQRLQAAREEARQRARQVNSFEGYAATLMGLGNAMGDKHIRWRPLVVPVTLDWAGLLLARRAGQWVVAQEDSAADGPPLAGARLVACDGVPAERLAEQRLGGFRAVWSVPAQQVAASPWLLVDDGNPFLRRPARCTFDQNGVMREIALRWRSARRAEVAPRMNNLVRSGAPGFGLRPSGAGWWIALQALSDKALPVVEAVRARADQMRKAPFVVLDMRGNSGGNSIYGDQILEALLGPAATRRREGAEARSCPPVWRTSPRNLRTLAQYARDALGRTGEQAARFWADQHRRGLEAQAAGRPLSGPANCGTEPSPAPARAAPENSLFSGRLILLTDHLCFSSCLLVADRFRQLGALHVGEATDAATRYFEFREERLPSGLGTFSTLQAVSTSSPYQIGPFLPDRAYDGDISDTAALERWVAELVAEDDG